MATHRQVVEICERVLSLPSGSVVSNVDKLRVAGLIPASQAAPEQATPDEAALIFLTAIVGTPMRHQPTIATAYAEMRESGWGPTLGERLAAILSGKGADTVVSLEVDLSAPGAVLLVATGAYGVPERFISDGHWPRPAFERKATIRGDLIRRIKHEIQTAPEVKKGRRKTEDKWKV